MLVVHAIWADGALRVWAEDSGRVADGAERPGQPAGKAPPGEPRAGAGRRAAPWHPFAAAQARLTELLTGLPGPAGPLARTAPAGELRLWLPTTAGTPLGSPELLPPPATGRGTAALRAWRVPVLSCPPADVPGLLVGLATPGLLAPDATAGGTLAYFGAVARFAADLVSRGRVLPGLTPHGAGYVARWQPVLTGADADWAADLARATPALARAAGAEPDSMPSVALLTAALAGLADATARARLTGADLRTAARPGRRPLPARWLAALTADDPRITPISDTERLVAAELARDLTAWLAAAQAPAGPVRTCFRLAEPDPDTQEPGPWRVEFALQSTADPSLMVPADVIWSGKVAPAAVAAGATHADELLLAGLGRAARLFPALETELREAAPVEVTMDTPGAFTFLRQTAPLLSGAGFGVLLPGWARRSRLGVKLTTRHTPNSSSASGPAGFGMNDLVEFRWDLAVGDDVLDADELERLAALKVPLVRLRGQWVELDDAHLKAALRFMERQRSGTMSAGEALLATVRGDEDELPLVEVDADGWLGDLLSGESDRRLAPVGAPPSFTGTLRPYQERGLAWLSFLGSLRLGGILADDMGLGKTVQVLALLAHEGSGPALLICPMSLVGNWQREAERFTPELSVHVHHGSQRLRGEDLAAQLGGTDLVITTYGVALRDAEQLAGLTWSRVICDEAQYIKNHATRAARAVSSLPALSRLALTGTPVENRLADLWSLMEFVSPGLLGTAEKFRRTYAIPVERGGDEVAAAALKRTTGPFILRRLKTDKTIISDLPEKLEMKVWCNLTAEQASLYQATVTDMLSRIEGAPDEVSRRGLVLATMTRLKQVCNHPAHLLGDGSRLPGRSGKLARLEEVCDEIVAAGEKALCFSQYAEFAGLLAPHLTARLGCPVLFLHGGTTKKRRDAMVSRFAELDGPAVFLLSLKAGGTGLNLTAANHVIHFDRWWNPAVENQATDRAFRIGQRKDVQVRTFVCVGTLEERIDSMIEVKKALAERIVGTGESWLADLSVEQLRSVIELAPEAVSP